MNFAYLNANTCRIIQCVHLPFMFRINSVFNRQLTKYVDPTCLLYVRRTQLACRSLIWYYKGKSLKVVRTNTSTQRSTWCRVKSPTRGSQRWIFALPYAHHMLLWQMFTDYNGWWIDCRLFAWPLIFLKISTLFFSIEIYALIYRFVWTCFIYKAYIASLCIVCTMYVSVFTYSSRVGYEQALVSSVRF